jgi:hypothetical protein
VVLFDRDIREDDVEPLLNAIRMLRCVQEVRPTLSSGEDWMARARARADIEAKVLEALRKETNP